jgi:DNA polymerase III alpha subunit
MSNSITASFFSQGSKYSLPILSQGVRLPEITITPEQKVALDLPPDATNYAYLKRLTWYKCLEKLKDNVFDHSRQQCIDRLKMEMDVFEKTGSVDYILLLLEVFGWCDKNGIRRGPARGSCAGSFALYCLDLIAVDALKYGLSFVRFINEARAKCKFVGGVPYLDGKNMPDFDCDISFILRQKLLDHLDSAYPDRSCKIATVQYLTGKMALKDALKIYCEISDADSKELSDEVEVKFGKCDALASAVKKSRKLGIWAKENPKAFKIACQLEGLQRTTGVHASGVLMSYYHLDDYMPRETTANGDVTSGYSMDYALKMCCKIDALGLRTLDQLELAAKYASIDWRKIDPTDTSIYKYFKDKSDFYGLFQIEEGSTKSATQKIQPKEVKDLSAVVAISRPGAIKYVDTYAKYVKEGVFKSIHPKMDPFIGFTGGVILYQEQIISICQEVYGMTPIDADSVRRAIGKKQVQELGKWELTIKDNGAKRGIPEDVTKWFWDTCNASADYLFNHCLDPNTIVITESGEKKLKDVTTSTRILALDTVTQQNHYVRVKRVYKSKAILFKVTFKNGRSITCSMKHELYCDNSDYPWKDRPFIMLPLFHVLLRDKQVVTQDGISHVASVERIGNESTVDIEVVSKDHNFYANGVVVSNSHSVSYCLLTAYTTYLKANYPTAFFLSCLQMAPHEQDSTSCIAAIRQELTRFGIPLYPPSLAAGNADHQIEGKGIRMGLSSIKGISEQTIGLFKNLNISSSNKLELFESLAQCKIGLTTSTPLILSGCMPFNEPRAKTLLDLEVYQELTQREKPLVHKVAAQYDYDVVRIVKALSNDLKDEKGQPHIKESRLATLRKDLERSFERFRRNKASGSITDWIMETSFLGFAHSTSLKEIYTAAGVDDLLSIAEIGDLAANNTRHDRNGPPVRFAAQIIEVEVRIAKESKNAYLKLIVGDETGKVFCLFFGEERIIEAKKNNDNKDYAEGQILLINGRAKSIDSVFIDSAVIQDVDVIVRKAQLTKETKEGANE